jgi:hypothetical protein
MSAFGTSYSFQAVDSPTDHVFIQSLGINNVGAFAGYSGDRSNLQNEGFTLVLPSTFASENFPRSAQTQVVGINNVFTGGVFEMVRFYIDSTSAQVPKTGHLADLHIEGDSSVFAALATSL